MVLACKTAEPIQTEICQSLIDNFDEICNDKRLSAILPEEMKQLHLENQHNKNNELSDRNERLNSLWLEFQNELKATFNDVEYKKRYTRQALTSSAILEWVPEQLIYDIYGAKTQSEKLAVIDPAFQSTLNQYNVTMMDLSYQDTLLTREDQELFLYTMLYVKGDDTNINDQKYRYTSRYYSVEDHPEWWRKTILFDNSRYGIALYQQAFNCAWQMYNELIGIKDFNKHKSSTYPHYPLHSFDDVITLYTNVLPITDQTGQYTLTAKDKGVVLNITRALLHLIRNKKFDYNDQLHDPASFVGYQQGVSWRSLLEPKMNLNQDKEIIKFFRSSDSYNMHGECSLLAFSKKDEHGDITRLADNKRSPANYDTLNKKRQFNNIIFNGVETTFLGRSKKLMSWILKLANDPNYKTSDEIMDSIANAFYVKEPHEALQVWLGILHQFPIKFFQWDKARFVIKGKEYWNIFADHIVYDEQGKIDIAQTADRLRVYIQTEDSPHSKEEFAAKVQLLLQQPKIIKELEKMRVWQSGRIESLGIENAKTYNGYQEFKIVTESGTEYQCIQKDPNQLLSNNDFGAGNHMFYDLKKIITMLMRPNNNVLDVSYDDLSNLVQSSMLNQYHALRDRAQGLWYFDDQSEDRFCPWKALSAQLVEQHRHTNQLDKLTLDDLPDEFVRNSTQHQEDYFLSEEENADPQIRERYYKVVFDFFFQELDTQYMTLAESEDRASKIYSKSLGNQRLLITQQKGYKTFIASRREETMQ